LFHVNGRTNEQTDMTKVIISKVHPCTGTEVLYRPYGP